MFLLLLLGIMVLLTSAAYSQQCFHQNLRSL